MKRYTDAHGEIRCGDAHTHLEIHPGRAHLQGCTDSHADRHGLTWEMHVTAPWRDTHSVPWEPHVSHGARHMGSWKRPRNLPLLASQFQERLGAGEGDSSSSLPSWLSALPAGDHIHTGCSVSRHLFTVNKTTAVSLRNISKWCPNGRRSTDSSSGLRASSPGAACG